MSAQKIKVVYIAGPFSGADGWEIAENVHRAEQAAREVARMGAAPLTPHSIGARMAGTETYEFWCAATLELMRRADAVLFIEGWGNSRGAQGEHAEAERMGMLCFFQMKELARWVRNTPMPGVDSKNRCRYTDLSGLLQCRLGIGHEGGHPVAADAPGYDYVLSNGFALAPKEED